MIDAEDEDEDVRLFKLSFVFTVAFPADVDEEMPFGTVDFASLSEPEPEPEPEAGPKPEPANQG